MTAAGRQGPVPSGKAIPDRPVSRWGAIAFPLASLGAHLAFIPLLVFLLPRRVETIAGPEAPLLLSWLLLAGGLAAGAAHIVAGYWSDRWIQRHGNRRGLIAIGLACLVATFVLLAGAATFAELAISLIAFQLALNLAFAPLGALLSDHVPDFSKGGVAGLLNAALPLSSGGIVLLAWLYPEDSSAAFIVNAVLVAACMAPLLIRWDFGPALRASEAPPGAASARTPLMLDFSLAWIARFLVQLGAAFLIGFLFLIVSGRIAASPGWAGGRSPSEAVALLSLAAALIAILGSVAGGRLSDGARRRRLPLAITACLAAISLAVLGLGADWPFFLSAYALFQLALAAFLAIDSALVAQLVTGNRHRGSMLGVMNLANTFPAVLAPAFAILSLEEEQSRAQLELFLQIGAGAAALAAVTVLLIRRVR